MHAAADAAAAVRRCVALYYRVVLFISDIRDYPIKFIISTK